MQTKYLRVLIHIRIKGEVGAVILVCHFTIGILGQVWYLIVSIYDLCTLTNFDCQSRFVCDAWWP